MTFFSRFRADEIDLENTKATGFKWYLWQPWGMRPSAVKRMFVPRGGPLQLEGDTDGRGGNVATAVPLGKGKFAGTSFGGGGYFEVTLKVDPATIDFSKGHPAFWALALEHLISSDGAHWDGQAPNFLHFIEVDPFEYNIREIGFYSGAMRDWFGIWNETCRPGLCDITTPYNDLKRRVPPYTNFNQYHRYGFLWVPASDRKPGLAEYYFDRERTRIVGKIR
jgi:hypothetical protein